MTTPLTFAGNAEAKLHVSTDTTDADWAVKLIDVHPDGFAQNMARGILRGRYRASLLKPELMQPGQVYEITVDLGPVAATIAKGHQLRVDISGADFPLYDRNPGTDKPSRDTRPSDWKRARQQVLHSATAPSTLELPLLP
jgi:putative CocE/NonD family hydrolase